MSLEDLKVEVFYRSFFIFELEEITTEVSDCLAVASIVILFVLCVTYEMC